MFLYMYIVTASSSIWMHAILVLVWK